jgi:hypothetical protein
MVTTAVGTFSDERANASWLNGSRSTVHQVPGGGPPPRGQLPTPANLLDGLDSSTVCPFGPVGSESTVYRLAVFGALQPSTDGVVQHGTRTIGRAERSHTLTRRPSNSTDGAGHSVQSGRARLCVRSAIGSLKPETRLAALWERCVVSDVAHANGATVLNHCGVPNIGNPLIAAECPCDIPPVQRTSGVVRDHQVRCEASFPIVADSVRESAR